MKLTNKNYLITGASSGLGLALVKRLLRLEGTTITAVARNIKSLERLPRDRVFPLSMDVAEPENVDAMIEAALSNMGRIDCLIACAGFGYYEQFAGKDYGHIERIFQTNVLSPLYTLQRLLDTAGGEVSFTVISSAIGKFGMPGMALYCATKFALDGFADAYRFEKPDRLHYMTVYPVGLATNFWERIATNIPLPRPLQQPEDAARAVLNGLRLEKRAIGSPPVATAVWALNHFLPLFAPLYQAWNMARFDKWRSGGYGAAAR